MKIIRYRYDGSDLLGLVIGDKCVSFKDISDNCNYKKYYTDIISYLKNLPDSRILADKLRLETDAESIGINISKVKPLPIICHPPALLDFALSPRHMQNSAANLIKNEFSGLKRFIALKLINKKVENSRNNPNYPYYKGNNCRISGDGDTINWPLYTSYLDIEPELAMIYGNDKEKIAGYVIFNDISARDVQVPELNELSLTRSKDFDNGVGSVLVTPDEVGTPLNLGVTVYINGEKRWIGDTSNYQISPEELISYVDKVYTPYPGSIIGMGTIPDCCSIETGEWLLPGDNFTIEFDKLGTLTQKISSDIGSLEKSRWKERVELNN